MTARSKIDGRNVLYQNNTSAWIFEDTGEVVPDNKLTGDAVPDNKLNVFRSQYRELSNEEKIQLNMVKEMAGNLLDVIEANVPDGRYKALAKTELEISIMWAGKGITE